MAGWVLCMTLLLAALGGAAGQSRYQNFLRQHVDPQTPGMPAQRYCNTMMVRRGMANPCKYTNTFVHAPAQNLVAACSQPLNAWGYQSTPRTLPVTVCRLVGGNTRPPCSYRAQQHQHYVSVACQAGLPVHLHRTYP